MADHLVFGTYCIDYWSCLRILQCSISGLYQRHHVPRV